MTVRRSLAALTLLPLALAGCSSGTTSGTATNAATTSTTSAAAASMYDLCDKPGDIDKDKFLAQQSKSTQSTAHVSGSVEIGALSSGSTTAPAASGSGTAGSTGSANGMAITGDIDGTDSANPKAKMTIGVPGGGGQLDLIMVDKAIYMNMGTLTGNKYAKLTLDDLAKQSGVDMNQLTDPTAQLAKAKDAITKVTCVGREDVSGTKTAHLRMTMDTAKAASLGGGTSTGTASPSASLPSGMPATMDTDLWVSAENRPVKVTSGTDEARTTMTYSKWGEPVSIQAPPSTSVTQLPGLGGSSADTGSATSTTKPTS
ncbi:MAG: LppX_LprAFG lipoprotein [Actinobacteria bacterium]|nr:LppX_LprAFG lipoprotein [Actinomycetota bacterium]